MTKSQYATHDETLAFALATHSAFGNSLAIVGMSLQDEYLRAQLEKFRPQLKTVIWFDSGFPEELSLWADAWQVECVSIDWSAFWQHWISNVDVDVPGADLRAAWYLALYEAHEEVSGGALCGLKRHIESEPQRWDESMVALADALAEAGRKRGEPAERLTLSFDPDTVLQAVDERIRNAGYVVPTPRRVGML